MRFILFTHSLVSDWNHGNAHFLRGVVSELLGRGHDVHVFEPRGGWSLQNLLRDAGPSALDAFNAAYPQLSSTPFDADTLDLDAALDGADVVIVHEWNPHELVERIGRHRAGGGRYVLLFHDTHHRSVSAPAAMAAYDLEHYDGVLAFGDVIRERYVGQGWARRAWTWHEAADTRVFRPAAVDRQKDGDLVWIGNWGDEERSDELRRCLIEPVADLGLRARVHGVRYPAEALQALDAARIEYGGWVANHRVPEIFAAFAFTVHIPRRPYVEALPGIPTIRVFEALACGIPLISCWWEDREGLFRTGIDYLAVHSPASMRRAMRDVRLDPALASTLAGNGLETIRRRHTCAHRVTELLDIVRTITDVPAERAISV